MDDFKIRPRQVDDWDKGTYAPVIARSPPRKGGRLYGLVYVVILVVLGVVCAILHHVFYTHLNGKSIDDATNELPALLRSQDNVGNIGTTIAHGARIAFSTAIGVTFAQLFWEVLRSGSHTIAQIDSLISCGQNPLQPSALRTIWTSFTLFAISVAASVLALVVVFSPGALTVSSGAERRATCTAPTILDGLSSPNSTYNTGSSQFPFGTLMVDFISTNSYLAPYQGNRSSICGFDMPCSYNLTFPGPTLSCEDNTDQLNLTTSPLGSPADTDGTLIIYDAEIGYPSLGIDIAVHDLAKSQIQSFNCTTYNATYQVGIEGSPPSVRIWNVTQNSVLNYSMGFMSDYAELALDGISGQVLGGPNGFLETGQSGKTPQLNAYFVTTPDGNLTYRTTAAEFVTSYLQNATISLLSGSIFVNSTTDPASNIGSVETTCSLSVDIYVYDSKRLWITYGVALGATMLVVLYGCLLILRNGREENFSLSDVIHVALNDEMYAASRSLTDHTKVYFVGNDASGKLLPTLPGGDGFGRSDSSSMGSGDLKPLPSIPRRSRFLTAVHAKMLLFLLATLICMIVHNAYYRYLDGKAPSFSLRASDSSSWSRNQTVVSDIGTAISYVAQVFLALVISASCVQLYWLAIRSRGHRIAQIDALMSVHTSPFSLPLLRALSASIPVCIVAMLASSASVVSIFAPSAIKLNTNHLQTNDCTVSTPRNLSSIVTPATDNNYLSPMGAVLASGSCLPPVVQCDLGSSSQCSYDLQFVGPGLSCEDVTAISNYTTFANGRQLDITGTVNLFQAITIPQDSNLFMQIAVGSWDVKRQLYQASNCTGVSRSYSVTLSKSTTTPYNINVTGNDVLSKIQANETSPPDFESFYMYSILNLMRQMRITIDGGYTPDAVLQVPINMNPTESVAGIPFGDNSGGGLGFYQLDSNITWADNMTQALEVFAQNMTMSLFSQQILNYNSNDPDVLQNVTTTCSTFAPAYEYTPYRLYLTYGVAIAVATVCAFWGAIAIAQNGAAENLDFSRILRSVLNERLFLAKDGLNADTRLRADDTVEGKLVPSLL